MGTFCRTDSIYPHDEVVALVWGEKRCERCLQIIMKTNPAVSLAFKEYMDG